MQLQIPNSQNKQQQQQQLFPREYESVRLSSVREAEVPRVTYVNLNVE